MDKNDYDRLANDSKIDPIKTTMNNVTTDLLNASSWNYSNNPEEDQRVRDQLRDNEIQIKRLFGLKDAEFIRNTDQLGKNSKKSSERSKSSMSDNTPKLKQHISCNIPKVVSNLPTGNKIFLELPKKKSLRDPKELKPRKSMKVMFDTGTRRKSIVHQILNDQNKAEIEKEQKRKTSIYSQIMAAQKRKKSLDFNPAVISSMISNSQKGTDYEKCQYRLKIYDIVLAALVFFNILFIIIDNNIYIEKTDLFIDEYTKENNITVVSVDLLEKMALREVSHVENTLRSLNLCLVIFMDIFIVLHYQIRIDLLKIDQRLSEYDNLFSSGLFKYMLLEIVVCSIIYPPGMNNVIAGQMLGMFYVYNYNSLFSIFSMLKMYIGLRAYSYFSRWTTDTAKSICNKYNVRMGLHLTIKSELKKRPMLVLSIMLIFCLGICSYCVRTFEYGVFDETSRSTANGIKASSNDLSTIANCMWLIIVTMTTVGYGDYYPKSHLGRFVGVVACIIGMLLVSMMVVSLTSVLDFTSEEKKAYSIIKKLHADDNAYCKATDVIKTVLMIRKTIHKRRERGSASLTEAFILITQLKRKITNFKNDYRIANSYALPIDEMLRRMESSLREDIKRIEGCIKKMGGINEQITEICKDQESFSERIDMVIKMQEEVSSYLVSLNNENFQKNLIKYKENNSKFGELSDASHNRKIQVTESESETDVIKLKSNPRTEGIFNKKHFTTIIKRDYGK